MKETKNIEGFATGEVFGFFGGFVATIADFMGGIFGDAISAYIKNEWEEIKESERPELYILDSIVGSFFCSALILGLVWFWNARKIKKLLQYM
tara:strand:- start:141 stop:419 length:279 start_codon:yes stop_codon:yes gene_type:complete